MTVAAKDLLARCRAILFDFDGPLCDMFAGKPAPEVAHQLEYLAGQSHHTDDPLEVLRVAFALNATNREQVEDELIRAEIQAVQISMPDIHGVRALRSFFERGRKTAIVSNNSSAAVWEFLESRHLSYTVETVIGRTYRHPELMKPDPWAINEALRSLDVESSRAVLIGYSMIDIEAARRARVHCIAFANKPEKRAAFASTGVPVITSMAEVVP